MKYISWYQAISQNLLNLYSHLRVPEDLAQYLEVAGLTQALCAFQGIHKGTWRALCLYIIPKLLTDILTAILLFYPCLDPTNLQLSRFYNVSVACFFSGWCSYLRHIADTSCSNSDYMNSSFLLRLPLVYPSLCHSLKSSFLLHKIRHWCFL